MEDGFELGLEFFDRAIVENVVIGGSDGATFFEVFDFADVAFADFGAVEGAFGAFGDAFVAQRFGGDDGDKSEIAGKFVFEKFVFGPRVDAVKDDALLAGFDEIFGLGDGLAGDPIFALGGTDHFAEFAFVVGAVWDVALFHFFVNHAAKVDFGDAAFGEVIDGDGFAGAAHADNSDDFDIFGI